MNKITVLSIGALLTVSSVFAQTNYSLDDVVQLARSKSPAWFSAETRKENQYWQYKTYRSDYNPQLVLSGMLPSFNKIVTPVTQPDGNVIYREVNNNTVQLQLGLSQVIGPTGGTISVFTDMSRYDDFIQDYVQFSGQPVSIGLNQPIFQFNQYKWNKLIQPLVYEESQRKYFEELEQISISATRQFFDLLLAQINLQIAEKNVESNDTIYQIAQGRYNLGKITENDLLQLELNMVNSRLDVSKALVEQQSAALNLKSFIGLSDNDLIQLALPENIPDFNIDENLALVEAIKNKVDVVSFKRRELEAKQEVTRAKRASGVNMNLQASYGLTNQGQTVNEVYQNPADALRVGLQMNVPIVDWGRQKSRLMTAEANMKLVQYQLVQDEVNFEQDILTEVRNFNMLREQLTARVKSDVIAQRAYDISKQLFLIGKITITELNQSLASKDRAKQSYITSLRDYWLAYYQIREKTLYDFHHNRILVRDIQTD
jgi:outer membrane protein